MSLITRFCPSPTGSLHVGGARTALFNWLLARGSEGGKFFLRLEDTDTKRSTPQSCLSLVEDLNWLGLLWDNIQIMRQSERIEVYDAIIKDLFDRGIAYWAFESADELDARREDAQNEKRPYVYQRPDMPHSKVKELLMEGRPGVVRLDVSKACASPILAFHDEVIGEVKIPREQLQDFVIRKSDGMPTYHFAVVVDDNEMGVNYILRGQEHMLNTFNHLQLYSTLGYGVPKFAHLPIILNKDGSKMSKRQENAGGEEVTVSDFRKNGYLPAALLNFIALLGWSPGGDREMMTIEEMAKLFSVGKVNRSNAKFDRKKLLSFNTKYIGDMPLNHLDDFLTYLQDQADSPLKRLSITRIGEILPLGKGCRTFREIDDKCAFFGLGNDFPKNNLPEEQMKLLHDLLPSFVPLYEHNWKAGAIEKAVRDFVDSSGHTFAEVASALRDAMTAQKVTPPLFHSMEIMGGPLCMFRYGAALVSAKEPQPA